MATWSATPPVRWRGRPPQGGGKSGCTCTVQFLSRPPSARARCGRGRRGLRQDAARSARPASAKTSRTAGAPKSACVSTDEPAAGPQAAPRRGRRARGRSAAGPRRSTKSARPGSWSRTSGSRSVALRGGHVGRVRDRSRSNVGGTPAASCGRSASARTNVTARREARRVAAGPRRSASGETSTAKTSASGRSCLTASAIAPAARPDVQHPRPLRGRGRRRSASSTTSSVSGRGMRTDGVTLSRRP